MDLNTSPRCKVGNKKAVAAHSGCVDLNIHSAKPFEPVRRRSPLGLRGFKFGGVPIENPRPLVAAHSGCVDLNIQLVPVWFT